MPATAPSSASWADFLGVGDVMSLVSGYLVNVSLINFLMGPRDLVLIDELAHNSIFVGAKNGRYDHRVFNHNDLDDLERQLEEVRGQYRNVLIVVEGLYSMDGDIPDLPRLVEMKEAHDAWLLVDEAHSYGVLGATGRGLCEHFDIDPRRIELTVGTLSKSFVSSGGFICAEQGVIDWLRFTLPGFVYSVGLSPATLGSAHGALTQLKAEPQRVTRLHENSLYFRDHARSMGLNTGPAIGCGVVPILFSSPMQTMIASQALLEQGVYAPPIVQIGVAERPAAHPLLPVGRPYARADGQGHRHCRRRGAWRGRGAGGGCSSRPSRAPDAGRAGSIGARGAHRAELASQ